MASRNWRGVERQLSVASCLPGVEEWRAQRRDWLGDAFQAHIEPAIEAGEPVEPQTSSEAPCQANRHRRLPLGCPDRVNRIVPTTIDNTTYIACSPESLYRYVTQPWRWHEWHPSSRWASNPGKSLSPGDRFQEEIELEPFSPLPVRMRRKTEYVVLTAEPFSAWAVRGETRDGWLEIRYAMQPVEGGTSFARSLTYETRGLSRLLMLFLESRMREKSLVALGNLKTRLETQVGGVDPVPGA